MLVADEALTEIQFPREVAPPASYNTQSPEVTNLEGLVGKRDAIHCPASFAHNAFFFLFLPFLGPLLWHMEVPRLGV